MKVHKDWIGSKKAATKGDLSELHEDVSLDLNEIKESMATKDVLKIVLDIVKQIDRRTKGWDHIPEDVVNLKNRVFLLEMKRK